MALALAPASFPPDSHLLTLDHSQSIFFYFVPQEKNLTSKQVWLLQPQHGDANPFVSLAGLTLLST